MSQLAITFAVSIATWSVYEAVFRKQVPWLPKVNFWLLFVASLAIQVLKYAV